MANLILRKSVTKPRRTDPSSTKMARERPEIIEISSDEYDSDPEDNTLTVYAKHQRMLTDKTRGPQHVEMPAPTSKAEANQPLAEGYPRHAKRQKIAHNNDPPPVMQQRSQPNPIVPPLPELNEIGLEFDYPDQVDPFGDNMYLALEPYTTFSAVEAFNPCTKPNSRFEDAQANMLLEAGDRPPVKKEKLCPYYQDPKLNTLMYRGLGHEEFPIVFGTHDSHQQVRDKWDQKEAAKAMRQQYHRVANAFPVVDILQEFPDQSSDEELDVKKQPSKAELTSLSEVREILPDIQQDFVLRILRSLKPQITQQHFEDRNNDLDTSSPIEQVMMLILEHESYPKEQKEAKEDCSRNTLGKTVPLVKGDPDVPSYRLDSVGLLAAHFERVPTFEINKIFQEKKSLYDAYLHIEHVEEKYYSMNKKPYKRLQKPRVHLERKYESYTERSHTNPTWRNIVNELQAAKQHIARENLRLVCEKETEELEAKNLETHRKSGNVVECKCCFDEEVALNRVVACEGHDLHWFCFSCVKNLAESQLGMMRYEMLCMDGSGCKASLSPQSLILAVSTKILDKLDLLQQRAEISAAGIDLEQCPHCDFQATCDDTIFRCQNRTCGRFTCRNCQQDAHSPKTCEEARKDKGLSARHIVEEARSEAMMRECPKCQVITDKESGGYQHFNAPGAVCGLYDKDFDRHDDDANKAEEKVIAEMRAENSSLDAEELQIETGTRKARKQKLKKAHLEDQAHAYAGLPRRPQFAGAMHDFGPDAVLHDIGRQRPAGAANKRIEIPQFGANRLEPIIPPQAQQVPGVLVDHTAQLTAAKRIHASLSEQHARLRRAVERARDTIGIEQAPRDVVPAARTEVARIKPIPAEMRNDKLPMAPGPNIAMNLDGQFDYKPIQYHQHAAAIPHLDWDHIYDHQFGQPAMGNLFGNIDTEHNRQPLFPEGHPPISNGMVWSRQRSLHRSDGDESDYEDALEMP